VALEGFVIRNLIKVVRENPRNSLVTIIAFPLLLAAVLEDTKDSVPWQLMLPIGTLGWAAGLLFFAKVLNPFLKFMDRKTARLLGIKE
jgi:hypothetical protein